MTQPDDDASAPDGPDEPRVTRPKPVRPRPAGRATTPKPVRAGLGGDADAEPVGVVEDAEAELHLDGETLVVRVRGRSRGHTSQGAADLLLLGFHRQAEEEPVRESLMVGDALEELTPLQLEAAWRSGRPPRDPFEETELFPETSRNRGRGRGR
jgi:hypothetical protein